MEQPQNRQCPGCSAMVAASATYCGYCGFHLAGQASPDSPTASVYRPAPPPHVFGNPYTPAPGYGPMTVPGDSPTSAREAASRPTYVSPNSLPYGIPLLYPPVVQAPPGMIQKFPGTHSVVGATVASLLLMSGGQFVNAQYGKGALLLLAPFITAIVLGNVLTNSTVAFGLFLLAGFTINIASVVDAYKIAVRINKGEAVGKWQCF